MRIMIDLQYQNGAMPKGLITRHYCNRSRTACESARLSFLVNSCHQKSSSCMYVHVSDNHVLEKNLDFTKSVWLTVLEISCDRTARIW